MTLKQQQQKSIYQNTKRLLKRFNIKPQDIDINLLNNINIQKEFDHLKMDYCLKNSGIIRMF